VEEEMDTSGDGGSKKRDRDSEKAPTLAESSRPCQRVRQMVTVTIAEGAQTFLNVDTAHALNASTLTLHAAGTPAGGAYVWASAGAVLNLNPAGADVALTPLVNTGMENVTVTYTHPNGVAPATAIIQIDVRVPVTGITLTVTQHATQTNVTGAKNWACVKSGVNDVVIEATTTPYNNLEEWQQIVWTNHTGNGDQANRKTLSRGVSQKVTITGAVQGHNDTVDIWIIWVTLTIKMNGQTPANAVQFGYNYDGTENLGSVYENVGQTKATGKVIPIGQITPVGVYQVVRAGWDIKRNRWNHDWNDGVKDAEGNGPDDGWNTTWIDDTSFPAYKKLIPDNSDKIYDNDAPNIAKWGNTDSEVYINFRQWVEWTGAATEKCSDDADWYWQGRWHGASNPQVTLKDLGTGHKALPADSFFHPPVI
jgi:hypothetical protein